MEHFPRNFPSPAPRSLTEPPFDARPGGPARGPPRERPRATRVRPPDDMPATRRRTRRPPRAAATLALAATAAASLAACDNASFVFQRAEAAVSTRDSAGVTIVENAPGADARVPRWTVADTSLRIGVVDGDPAYQFDTPIAAAALAGGRTAVVDYGSRQVRLYDRDGRALAVRGREGGGPGEFRWPAGVWALPGDSLAVYDRSLDRITILHGDSLEVARVAPVERDLASPRAAGLLDGRRLVVGETKYDFQGPIRPQDFVVRTLSIEGDAATDSLFPATDRRFGHIPGILELGREIASPIWDARGRLAARHDRIVYGPGDDYALRVHDPDGRLRRIVRWHGPDRTVDPGEVDRWVDSVVAATWEGGRARQRQWFDLLPRPERRPAHARVLLDAAGRAWVGRWAPGTDNTPTDWWVFDEAGRLLATAEVPPGLFILDIGEDAIVGYVTDELDVEYIVRLPVPAIDKSMQP